MSTQETEAGNDATPNRSTPPILTRANTEEAIEYPLSLCIRPSRIIEDNENTSSATDPPQNPISKCSSLATVITIPDNGDEELNQISPPAELRREPSIPVGYPPSFFQLGFYSNPESSNSLLGYADPDVTTDLERYPVDAQASGDDAGLLTAVGLSTFTTPLSVTSTLYTHDLVITQDKGKGKADPSDNDNKNVWPSPSIDEDDDDRDFNLTDLKIYRDAAAWKTTRMQLGEAGPSRMPYTSQVEDEEDEGRSDWEELDDSQPSSRRIGKSKSGDHDEFVASSDKEYSKSQDSDWSLSKSASPPPVKVKCRKASKRKFSDSSSDESEQPTKRKRSKKEVHPSPPRAKGEKIEEEDYEDSDKFISSPRTVAGISKSSLGKRKRKSTRNEAPIVQRKRPRRIIESSEEDDYPSAAETPPVKTKKKHSLKTKQVKSSKTQISKVPYSDLPKLFSCPAEGCSKAMRKVCDLKRHVYTHPPSKHTVRWLQAHNEDLSNGFLAWYGCAVPGCQSRFSRNDALQRHHRINHESLYAKDPNSDIMQAIKGYVDVTIYMDKDLISKRL